MGVPEGHFYRIPMQGALFASRFRVTQGSSFGRHLDTEGGLPHTSAALEVLQEELQRRVDFFHTKEWTLLFEGRHLRFAKEDFNNSTCVWQDDEGAPDEILRGGGGARGPHASVACFGSARISHSCVRFIARRRDALCVR